MGTTPSKEQEEDCIIHRKESRDSSSPSTASLSVEASTHPMHGKEKRNSEELVDTMTAPHAGHVPKAGEYENENLAEPQLAQPDDREEVVIPRSPIRDEQVQVNLAMADLMAYLQVVANNSNNLPLTRRDDPELHRMVSSLTSEEYARKSAAFIPADVRVISGTFTKYGRVWDLPTSDEYNAEDGAQEPGKLCLLSNVFWCTWSYTFIRRRSILRRRLL